MTTAVEVSVLADGVVVGRIMKAAAKPADASWCKRLSASKNPS